MLANTAEIKVGRLLEVRIAAGYRTVEDVDALFDTLDAHVAKLPPGVGPVTGADWTPCVTALLLGQREKHRAGRAPDHRREHPPAPVPHRAARPRPPGLTPAHSS